MLTANVGAMDLLPDEGPAFSVREWIEREEAGFLFLTSRGDQHASLRGLISTWLEIAVNALLSLPREDGRRIWVILDELPTLHQLPSLRPGLAESRQFGGCFVLRANGCRGRSASGRSDLRRDRAPLSLSPVQCKSAGWMAPVLAMRKRSANRGSRRKKAAQARQSARLRPVLPQARASKLS